MRLPPNADHLVWRRVGSAGLLESGGEPQQRGQDPVRLPLLSKGHQGGNLDIRVVDRYSRGDIKGTVKPAI